MPTRIQSRTVTFRRPFVLAGFDRIEPAGTYTVDTEEETPDDVSFAVWKRCATVMHIVRDGTIAYVRIDPEDLRKALSRDEAPGEPLLAQAQLDAGRHRNATRLARRKKF